MPSNPSSIALALAAIQRGAPNDAASMCRATLTQDQKDFGAHLLLGVALLMLGQYADAEAALSRAAGLPEGLTNPDVFQNRGVANLQLAQFEAALADFETALRLAPGSIPSLTCRGHALSDLGRLQEAEAAYRQVAALAPDYPDLFGGRAHLYLRTGRFAEAIADFDRAIQSTPLNAALYLGLGQAHFAIQAYDAAFEATNRAEALLPRDATVLTFAASTLVRLSRLSEAVDKYDAALEADPANVQALFGRSQVLFGLKEFSRSLADLKAAYALRPNLPQLAGTLLLVARFCCDWTDDANILDYLVSAIRRGEPCAPPFPLMVACPNAEQQFLGIEAYLQTRPFGAVRAADIPTGRQQSGRLRIGYVSGEFREHPTAYLICGLLEAHDKAGFEIIGISIGLRDESEIGRRMMNAVDRFVDCERLPDAAAAQTIADLNCDVLVDLSGYVNSGRPAIFASRPGRIQVNYLGFPGTMGRGFMDYLLADNQLVEAGEEVFYGEAVCRLPNSYQCTNPDLTFAATKPRDAYGLPADQFVFASLNHCYKISPPVFDVWMRILRARPESVFWILAESSAQETLRAEAARRNVDPGRLIFADRVPNAEHLARQQLADLCLDTFPCTAHTTATEALLAGVPIVTLRGATFAGRVAASVLHALECPELVTRTIDEYERLALRLSATSGELEQLKTKIRLNKGTTALFDKQRFTRNIERAYRTMAARSVAGLHPAGFDVEEVDAD